MLYKHPYKYIRASGSIPIGRFKCFNEFFFILLIYSCFGDFEIKLMIPEGLSNACFAKHNKYLWPYD